MRGHVGCRRVDRRPEVTERQLVGQFAGVVGVEGAPAAVLGLHADNPGPGTPQRAARPVRVGVGHPAQRQPHLRGVVDVRVQVVGELERPAAGREIRPAHRPVAGHRDLLAQQPVGGPPHRRAVRGFARVEQADDGQRGVPDRGLAGLQPAHPAVRGVLVDEEPVEAAQPGLQHGVGERVAEQVQGHDRINPRRLDAPPGAVRLLPRDDPFGGAAQRQPPHRPQRMPAVEVQAPVQALEGTAPRAQRGGRRGRCAGPQLVDADGQRADRPQGSHDRQRHDRLPGPAAEVVDVEGEPLRQEDQLRRQVGQVVPRPQPEQREPQPGEHAAALDSALPPDERHGRPHVRGVRVVAGELEGDVGLQRRGQVRGAALEVGPRAVGTLLRADPARCLLGLRRRSGCPGTPAGGGLRHPS